MRQNLYAALCRASREADHVVGDASNPAKNTVYSTTANALNVVRPILARHGLCLTFAPGRFESAIINSTTKNGDAFSENAGVASIAYVLIHESGEAITGEASMPVNIGNKGLSSADKAMGAWTIMTRKVALGLLGVVEVGSEEKTLAAANEKQSAEETAMSDAIGEMHEAQSVEELGAILKKYRPIVGHGALDALTKVATDRKREILQAQGGAA